MKKFLLSILTIGSILLYTVVGQEVDVSGDRWKGEAQQVQTVDPKRQTLVENGNLMYWRGYTFYKFEHTDVSTLDATNKARYDELVNMGTDLGFIIGGNSNYFYLPEVRYVQFQLGCSYEQAEALRFFELTNLISVLCPTYKKMLNEAINRLNSAK